MKIKLLITLMLISLNLFSQKIDFNAQLLLDNDTISKSNYNILIKINLTDRIYIETVYKENVIFSSEKKRILEESVNDGVVTFKTIDEETYNFKIFEEYAELTIDSDLNLKWIGTYNINFNIMMR